MYTTKEQKTFNGIAAESFDGGVSEISDVVEHTGLSAKEARGVLSSLVKKGRVVVEEFENFGVPTLIHYWPVRKDGSDRGVFWIDCLNREEFEAELITDEEVN